MADGFKTGIDRLAATVTAAPIKQALAEFLNHVQTGCQIPTAFDRATQAFYLPFDALGLQPPPTWWTLLTSECWSELLADDSDEPSSDLSIICTNAILPVTRGIPAIV